MDLLKTISDNCMFYDIDPENEGITKSDFLKLENPTGNRSIHIIGNPPFGRQSSMAIKFIKKSCEFASSISFILPKSFKKESMRKHFPKNFHLLCEIDLPENSFTVDGTDCDVPCVFQIWKKRSFNRPEIVKLTPKGFIFVKRSEKPDISFRRVGVNAGTVSRSSGSKSVQSHYFIKFTNNKEIDYNFSKVSELKFESNNTVGPKSISKQELVEKFNEVLNDL
jgi:hypothetical protein